jgi:hypothetical protein
MEVVEDKDGMLPWYVDDHCHEELTLLEYERAMPGIYFKLACRGQENGNLPYHLFICPLCFLDIKDIMCTQHLNNTFATHLNR